MIIQELRDEIRVAISRYLKKYTSQGQPSLERQADIKIIKQFLNSNDAILIRHKIICYLDGITIPFFSFMPFFDTNQFVNAIKSVLNQEKFQELNLLRTIISEQEQIISCLQKSSLQALDVSISDNKLEELFVEVKMLRRENEFLFSTIINLDKKISVIEKESKQSLERALSAESELDQLKLNMNNMPINNQLLTECRVSTQGRRAFLGVTRPS